MKGKIILVSAFGCVLTMGAATAWAQAPRAVAASPVGASPRLEPRAESRSDPAPGGESRQPAPSGYGGGAAISSAAGDYVLSNADTLEMSIFGEPKLSTRSKVGSDGTVLLPLINEVKVSGLTIREAREVIRRRYDADYLVDPQVSLNILDFAQRQFTILGQVVKPGAFPFPGGRPMSLLEAIGIAGGFTRSADRGKVIIKRTTDGGTEGTITVNAKKLAAGGKGTFNILPGDVISVGESWF